MPFTREDVAAYEKAPAATVPVVAAAKPAVATTPDSTVIPADTTPAPATGDSSATVDSDPAVPGSDDPSADTADTAPATADDSGSETDPTAEVDTDQSAVPPKGSAQERIADLVAERNAVRKYAEHQARVIEEQLGLLKTLQGQPAAAKDPTVSAAPAAKAADADPSPKLEDFNHDYDAFAQAQTAWNTREIARQVKAGVDDALKSNGVQTPEEKAIVAFEDRATEFRKTHADFDKVLSNPSLPKLSAKAARQIVFSEQSAAIAYHLGRNPDVATRISRMVPDQQSAALFRLEGQLQAAATAQPTATTTTPAAKPKPKVVTQAPKPPTPVPAGSGTASIDITKMSMEEFVAHERQTKAAERAARRNMVKAMRS